ncbi:methionine--tRNA ligase [Candidatus Gottesmanbacteria bacterium RIFCSPLOWO2_01_FULL_39_12b]|uniref:Methionine--tRNA ligase n=1 Tax=Candidatus Gottesmanbacteria bacterium RIFCSPLOWO2_01_FULL_39_12b TaxID=1798388 RepID=A0A1F6AP03_9BACT|nr:MAG: methionine--tRNA ligase [Candidatus Gottesmanbacteria bacterium RIFCSPLOWO2_01_FULL_39_12b]
MSKFYLTSAIPYVNASPHIGHAQEFVYTDVIKRFQILKGKKVTYLCGADENGLKIVQAAEKANQSPQLFCDIHQKEFLDLAQKLDVEFNIWQRGTDRDRHFLASQKLWQLCDQNGDIYKKSYTGLYCIGCETFYTEDELDKKGECFEHPGKKLEKVSEENYFFRLSKYQKFLKELVINDCLRIIPEIRKKEALSFINNGLKDFSVSRSKKRAKNWGVPVPNNPNQIIYVWFDALNIYQSGIGFGWNEKLYKIWSPQDVMVIGKGILRFHAIYWPAILKSAGLKLPKNLFIHGYLTVDGQKMSKTLGNVVDPIEMIKKYRGADPLRYYLLREIPSYSDGDFSERRFKELYNADLANGLGNLVSRVAKLCETSKLDFSSIDLKIFKSIKSNRVLNEIEPLLENFKFDNALERIWKSIKGLDAYIDRERPWEKTAREAKKRLEVMVKGSKAVVSLLEIGYALQPFLPETSRKILEQFSAPKIKFESPLFPRIK